MTLNQLNKGEMAKVVDFKGGYGFIEKLNALGITKGKKITKISGSFLGGPVTVTVGQAKLAVGNGMAEKIIVERINDL